MQNQYFKYVWLYDTIRSHPNITLREISRHWEENDMSNGAELARSTFNDWRECVETLFNVQIICSRHKEGSCYRIRQNPYIRNSNIDDWLISTMNISSHIADTKKLRGRIILEKIPSGDHYLQPIINAMKQSKVIHLQYQKFGDDAPTLRILEPYCVKVFNKRWYVLGRQVDINEMRTFALDRIKGIEQTDTKFRMPKDFSVTDHYRYTYGIYTGKDMKPETVRIRAYGVMVDYLRTLPLHESQKEIIPQGAKANAKSRYVDFEYKIGITYDFEQFLLAQMNQVEVLEPASLRKKMKETINMMQQIYN